MWVIAIIGSASAFIESTLAQIYKKKNADGTYSGGPAYYIGTALKNKPLAVIFTILLIFTYGVGFNMLASYNLQSTFSSYSFYNTETTPWIIGIILAVICGYCLIGGGKRIISVTSVLVPIMGCAYILVALIIVAINFKALPDIFKTIFTEAFDFGAIFGGFSGSCVMFGIKRGLFSNEAGVGSAPNASASADVQHPVKQGLVQVLSVFIDTILVCSASAFMCMCSGIEPSAELSGAPYVQAALQQSLGNFGPIFITVAMLLFAFTTLLGNVYYVDMAIIYLCKKEPKKWVMNLYHIIAAALIFIGAGLSADLLWNIADIAMGGMTIINIPVILILSKYAVAALKDYDKQRKQGVTPVFKAKSINLPHDVDCWK
jgi:AGCS family alanine or glycine:cation symporter